MRLPVKDRRTQPYMTEREIRAIKRAIAACKKYLANDQQMSIQLDASAKRTRAAGKRVKRQVKEAPHDMH